MKNACNLMLYEIFYVPECLQITWVNFRFDPSPKQDIHRFWIWGCTEAKEKKITRDDELTNAASIPREQISLYVEAYHLISKRCH